MSFAKWITQKTKHELREDVQRLQQENERLKAENKRLLEGVMVVYSNLQRGSVKGAHANAKIVVDGGNVIKPPLQE